MLVLNQLQRSLKNCESDIKARVGLAMGRFIHDDNDDPNHLDKAIAELENIVKFDIDKLIDPLKNLLLSILNDQSFFLLIVVVICAMSEATKTYSFICEQNQQCWD
jgi:hypothetical protein